MSTMRRNCRFLAARWRLRNKDAGQRGLVEGNFEENEEKTGRKVHASLGSKRESIGASSMQVAYIHLLLLCFLLSFPLSLALRSFSSSPGIELLFYLPISLPQCIPPRKFSYLWTPCWRTNPGRILPGCWGCFMELPNWPTQTSISTA